MSIARFATRLLTRLALLDNTIAEDRVEDSSIVNLEARIAAAPKPIVLIYTDDSEFAPQGRELTGGQGSTTIVIILAIAGAYQMESGEVQFSFPATDKALEMGLDFLERQIEIALMDPDNKWGILWHKLVTNVNKVSSRRGGSTKEGTRFAARQIIMEVETVHDPVMGSEPEGAWAELINELRNSGNDDISGVADPLQAMITGRTLTSWERVQAEFGFSRETLKGIALQPVRFHSAQPDGNSEPALLSSITLFPLGISTDSDAVKGEHDDDA